MSTESSIAVICESSKEFVAWAEAHPSIPANWVGTEKDATTHKWSDVVILGGAVAKPELLKLYQDIRYEINPEAWQKTLW